MSFFIVAIVLIPLVAGFIANLIVGKGKGFLPWEFFVAGIIGSFVGGAIGNLLSGRGIFGGEGIDLHPSYLLGSTVGAIIVLAVWGWWRMRAAKAKKA